MKIRIVAVAVFALVIFSMCSWLNSAPNKINGGTQIQSGTITGTQIATNSALVVASVNASGVATASQFVGGGLGLTGISASNISSGTLGDARFSAYSDLSTESKIGTGGTQVSAGDHNHAATYVDVAGDTMTGALIINNDLTATGTIQGGSFNTSGNATAGFFFGNGAGLTSVTGTDSTKLLKAGDTMSGDLAMGTNDISGVGMLTWATSEVGPSSAITSDGCFTIEYLNQSGATLTQGYAVRMSTASDSAIISTGADASDTVGFIQNSTCAADATCNVGVSGLCKVKFGTNNTCTRAYFVYADAGEAGLSECSATPTSQKKYGFNTQDTGASTNTIKLVNIQF